MLESGEHFEPQALWSREFFPQIRALIIQMYGPSVQRNASS